MTAVKGVKWVQSTVIVSPLRAPWGNAACTDIVPYNISPG
jgi:hypothetical protein